MNCNRRLRNSVRVFSIEKALTSPKESDIVINDELPETVGAEKRKDKTPTEERIVVSLFKYTSSSQSRLEFFFYISAVII